MLGHMLSYIRKNKNLTKARIAKESHINTGHLTHIEKGERNPSSKVLKGICSAMSIPYRSLLYTLDKKLTEEQLEYNVERHIPYDKILAVDTMDNFIDCPLELPGACIAIKMPDESLEPKIMKGSYTYLEFSVPLSNKDIGLFYYQGKLLIRRFIIRKDGLVLRAEDRNITPDICLEPSDDFKIVGKIVGFTEENGETVIL